MSDDTSATQNDSTFSVAPTPECVAQLQRWAQLIREMRQRINLVHQSIEVSSEEIIQQEWFDQHDLDIATALDALAQLLQNTIDLANTPRVKLFDYEYTFSLSPLLNPDDSIYGERRDLALRVTKVHSETPVTFMMIDQFLEHADDSVFCEAYLADGTVAIEPLAWNDFSPPKKSLLTPGATVFLRDIPITWWQQTEVVEALAALVQECCKVDRGAESRERGTQSREQLAEAMREMFDLVDTGERLLRRNREPVTITFSDDAAIAFWRYLAEFDGAVLSVTKKPLEPHYTATVLIHEQNQKTFLQRMGATKDG